MVDAQFSTPEWTCVADDGQVFCESKENDLTANFRTDGDIDVQTGSQLDVKQQSDRVLVREKGSRSNFSPDEIEDMVEGGNNGR